jgi:hypothetical protein
MIAAVTTKVMKMPNINFKRIILFCFKAIRGFPFKHSSFNNQFGNL